MSVDAIEKALGEFELIGGVGGEAEKKACAMTLLAWVCGEPWTDHPPCAHRIIANNVIRANDHPQTTPEMRRELVRAGRTGVLDTWWVPGEAIVMSLALKEADSRDVYERTMRLLTRIAEWKDGGKERPVLRGADLSEAVLRGADLSGADLREAVLSEADLSEAVLRGAVLSGADLSEAVLRGADLSGAVLRGAVLSGAVLSGAVLRGAVLSGAVLSGAVLRGADLSEADLSEAVLRGAVLSGAVLRGADLRGAVLRGADLSEAVGTPYGGMPSGWKLSESGLWVRS
jgi:hypothetical protein